MGRPTFESDWDGFKGHVAVKWDRISDEELLRVQGNFADLVKLISEKYGEQKQAVEQKRDALYTSWLARKEDIQARSQAFISSVKDKAQVLQEEAREKIRLIREENIDPALRKSEDYIKVHPFTAVLGAMGIGLLVGGIVGFLSRKGD